PIDRLYENELFVDRYGFESALSSVYNSLGSNALYGRELKFGFLETLVGSYNNITATGHRYYRHNRHEYTFPATQSSINGIWSGFYNSINQLNIILNNVDNISTDPYHDLVKGE